MNDRGNAFIYILIAIVLFAGLGFAISRSSQNSSVSELDQGRTSIAANDILAYAAATQNAIATLDRLGTGPAQIDFVLPSDSVAFNSAPNVDKLFHPDGGGLTYKPLPRDAVDATYTDPPEPGFFIGRFNNVEWTPTTEDDVIFVALGIPQAVCEELNRKITGSAAIPELQSDLEATLVDVVHHAGGNSDLVAANCADCEEKSAICLTDTAHYAFYSVMVPR